MSEAGLTCEADDVHLESMRNRDSNSDWEPPGEDDI